MWKICQAEDSREISSIILSEKQRLSSAVVVIGALRVNFLIFITDHAWEYWD